MQATETTTFGEEKMGETGTLLALGVEPEGVRACLLDNVSGQYRLIGWVGIQKDPALEMTQQLGDACQRLGTRLGRQLWQTTQEGPLTSSEDEIRYPALSQVVAGIMPRPRLRVWLVGLSHSLGLHPLAQAVTGSPVQIVGQTQLMANLTSGQLLHTFLAAQPEAIVLVGGYDDPAPAIQNALLFLSKVVGQAVARLAPGQRPKLFYAGNQFAAEQASALLNAGDGPLQVECLENFQPAPGVIQSTALLHALTLHYWRQCQRVPGFAQLSRWVTPPAQVTNLASSFTQLTQAWLVYQRLADLHSLYCTNEWWLHVWVSQRAGLRRCFVEPQTQPASLNAWPATQLLCGDGRQRTRTAAPWPALRWWDRNGLAPIIATVGQVAPLAMLQVCQNDLFAPANEERT
jgi:hypothetical protein